MSATLTWHNSGLGTKTGTAIGNLFADLETLIDSKAADANFSWEKASANVGSTPYYIVLKRKDASIGRILLVAYSSAPAANNAAIFATTPTSNCLYMTFFPAGNADTPSALESASGTILGDDTDVLACITGGYTTSSIYGSNLQPFYFDSAEAVMFGFQNPASAACYLTGAGYLVVDANDDTYAAVWRTSAASAANFGSATNPMLPWTTTVPSTTGATAAILANYGGVSLVYQQAFHASGNWASQPIGADDILTDTANSRAYFVPVPLMGHTKGEGIVLKLRQIAWGPGTTAAFTEYSTTGPVTAARQFNAFTTGGSGYPWFTNFKI